MPHAIVGQALDLREYGTLRRITGQSPAVWPEDHSGRDRFLAGTDEPRAMRRRTGEARREERGAAKAAMRLR